jgi:hypothetical protein
MDDNQPQNEPAPIKRTFTINEDTGIKLEQKNSGKKWGGILLVLGIITIAAILGFIFFQMRGLVGTSQPSPEPSPTPIPSPSPEPVLQRSDWSFEILNGSGASGAAKNIAAKVQELGYRVVKTGNADKSNYADTQILVQKDLLEKVDLIAADLKDVIRIATVAGELKDSTASARIIIGKDAI